MKFLACPPEYFNIEYAINPWTSLDVQPSKVVAAYQWNTLTDLILDLKCDIEIIPQVKECPDMVFTANAGFIHENTVILPNFAYKERQQEAEQFKQWFVNNEYNTIILPNNIHFEGQADSHLVNEVLFGAFGQRTHKEAQEIICYTYNIKHFVPCELITKKFYHLDMCFLALNNEHALFYRDAFSTKSINEMEKHIELHDITEIEASNLVCNSIIINDNIIMPTQTLTHTTLELLSTLKYTIHYCNVGEFKKAGGACKCLVLKF